MRSLPALLLALVALLGCRPDPYPGEQGVVLHGWLDTLPKSLDPPLVGLQQTGDNVDERRLPRSVQTDDRQNLIATTSTKGSARA